MAEITIYTRASRAAIRRAIATIPQEAMGGGSLANALLVRCGLAALGRIRQAFIVKSRGGTDEAGERWQPLSPKTVAYGRRGGRTRGESRRSSTPSQALNSRQQARWWDLYRQGIAIFKGNKPSAARRAWAILKTEGAPTILSKYGNREVEILRDTGLLLNSLSPGTASPDQVFRVGRGEVIIGTNRKGAAAHHTGVPGRLPQRRLWPAPNKWPASWWKDIQTQARDGLVAIIVQLVRRTT